MSLFAEHAAKISVNLFFRPGEITVIMARKNTWKIRVKKV